MSFYFDVLILVCTFDPIPMDVIYEVIPIWEFDKIGMENDVEVFGRLGMEDRNIIPILGSIVLFMAILIA